MNQAILFMMVLYSSLYGASQFGCTDHVTFHYENLKHFSQDIQQWKDRRNLMEILGIRGTLLAYRPNGKVKNLKDGKENWMMTMLDIETPLEKERVINEVRLMKQACGENPELVFEGSISCEGKAIQPFKACAEYKNVVMFIQKRGFNSLKDKDVLKKYKKFDPIKRAEIMLNILEKVAGLHRTGIIHSDISLSSIIAKDSHLQDFELMDLKTAGLKNSEFIGKPERHHPPELKVTPRYLTPQVDIYLLGITLLDLEGDFSEHIENMNYKCFTVEFTKKCHEDLLEGIPKILSTKRGLFELIPVFNNALAFAGEDRFSSAEEFSIAIVKLLSKIPNNQPYLYNTLLERKKNQKNTQIQNPKDGETSSSIYNWKNMARELGLGAKPPGFFDKLGNLIGYFEGNNKKVQIAPMQRILTGTQNIGVTGEPEIII